MARRPGIFPTFFLSGFECSTFLWKDRRRRDLVEETQHRRHAREDYDRLRLVWERYRRPMVIGETSGMGRGRAAWLKDVMEESLAAVEEGMDLHGICLFPAVDMPDWHTGQWIHNGICDLVEEGAT
jgi:hypothetical protein